MATITFDLPVSQLIDAVKNLGSAERRKILNALYDMEEERAIDEALQESMTDADQGHVYPHASVMSETRAKYGL